MFYYVGMAVGWSMVIGSAYKMFKVLNKSLVIEKREFEKIENKIRKDERKKIFSKVVIIDKNEFENVKRRDQDQEDEEEEGQEEEDHESKNRLKVIK